ncbi:MAG: hypothetical protein Q9195_007159 [Heterodermia aff. obscurata]
MSLDSQPHGAPPASAALESVRLKGHIGHLTEEEGSALDKFKALAAQKGFYTPVGPSGKASHDDGTLVRYLRARKFVPQDAFQQFSDTEKWRKDNDLEALYEKIDVHDYQEARSVYPQWTGRRDKRGIPVYLYEVGKLDSKKMIAYSSSTSKSKIKGPSPSRMLRLFALYENLTRFVMPLCSSIPGRPNPETPVDQSNNIVDISRVGLKQFWNLRGHMQDASQLATAHYPETLDRIFIIGAPSFFPTVWGWIKKWFDPITTSKIFILSEKDVLPTLSAFIDIESIPKKYGGKLDFECGKLPLIDSQVRAALDLRGAEDMFLTAPVRWMDDENGELMALGVGSVDGHERKERMAVLHQIAVRQLTRSSTHQGAIPQYKPTAETESQSVQPSILHTVQRNEKEGRTDSRPQSKHQQLDGTSEKDHPVQQHAPPPYDPEASLNPMEKQPQAQEPLAPLGQRLDPTFTESHSDPAKTLTSSVPNGKPTSIEMPIRNGAPPPLDRTETKYLTPPSDPSEIPKQFP